MSELNFAKSFLTTLDSKTTKYQPDHVFDPKTFATRIPFTLPRLSHPPHPNPPTTSSSALPPGSEPTPRTTIILLKSPRNPNLSLSLPASNPQTTTISALKAAVQSALGGPTTVDDSRIKILWNKKPIPAAKKTVADALDNPLSPASEVEFGVMVMGGAPDPPQQAQPVLTSTSAAGAQVSTSAPAATEGLQKAKSPSVAQGTSAREVLSNPQFWTDLEGFLQQRLRDDEEARLLMRVFEEAWRNVEKATSNL